MKYTEEFKQGIVKRVLEDGMGMNEIGREVGVHHSMVEEWVAAYEAHGAAGLVKEYKRYTGEFKQMVVEDMRSNGLSGRQTATKYNLGSHHMAEKWERIYLSEGVVGLHIERRGQRSKGEASHRQPAEEDLLAEVHRLRMENEYLKKLNALVRERKLSEMKRKHR